MYVCIIKNCTIKLFLYFGVVINFNDNTLRLIVANYIINVLILVITIRTIELLFTVTSYYNII